MLTPPKRLDIMIMSKNMVSVQYNGVINPLEPMLFDTARTLFRGVFVVIGGAGYTLPNCPNRGSKASRELEPKNVLLDLCPRIKQDYRRINSAVRLYCTPKGNMQSGLPPIQGVLIESKTFSPADYILQAGFTEIELTTYCE